MRNIVFCRYLHALPMIFVLIIAMQIDVFAKKDEWKIIRAKDVQVIGNASERQLRRVHLRVLQLQNVFSELFDSKNLHTNVPTNIIVFKDEKSYRKFKPVEEGKRKDWVAGYFQPGEDVNHIVFSTKKNEENTKRTIFHEYTHSLVNSYFGQENVPPWVNEGLAEYFENLQIQDNRKATVGIRRLPHGQTAKPFQIVPLEKFFKTDYISIRKFNKDEIESFYAQAWFLIHYILNGNGDEQTVKMKQFILSITKGNLPKDAYKDILGAKTEDLENDLRNYVKREIFSVKTLNLSNNIETSINPQPISVAEAKAFQGDLFYNMQRFDEAEIYLNEALSLNPRLSLANTSLGLIKMKEGKFAEAKKYLETALENDPENYLINYRYAYILSREDIDQIGYIRQFDEETFENMSKCLKKAMSLNPQFAGSFYLHAFINLVQNVNYDDGIAMLEKALAISPNDQWYWMRMSEFYYRKKDLQKAKEIALKVAETTTDSKLLDYAQRNLQIIEDYRLKLEKEKEYQNIAKNFVRSSDGVLTEEEQEKLREISVIEALDQMLRKPKEGEVRMIGVLSKIDCEKEGIYYFVETKEKKVIFRSATFENLRLAVFNYSWKGEKIGCGSSFPDKSVIVTYRPNADLNKKDIGEVIGIEFVPEYFRFPEQTKMANN